MLLNVGVKQLEIQNNLSLLEKSGLRGGSFQIGGVDWQFKKKPEETSVI